MKQWVVEVVIRPEDYESLLPEEGKLQVKVDISFSVGSLRIIAYDELGNEWMIHSTRKAIVGEEMVWTLNQKISTSCVSTKPKKKFDARIEWVRRIEEQEAGLINAIEEERDEENNL